MPILSWDEWKVLPSKTLSPAGAFVANGCKYLGTPGLVLMQTGPAQAILPHAARSCFWDIGLPQLQKVAKDLGVEPSAPVLYDTCDALVRDLLPGLEEAAYQRILALRGVSPHDPLPKTVPEEVLEEVFDKDGLKDYTVVHLVL